MANQILSVEKCRLTLENNPQSDINLDQQLDRDLQERYTLEDDYQIINYIVKNTAFDNIRCDFLWTNMQLELGNRTQSSLRNRYLEHIIPKLHMYYIPEPITLMIKKGYQKSSSSFNVNLEKKLPNEILTGQKTLQLDKLRSSLVEKLNFLRNDSTRNMPPQPTAVTSVPDGPKCVDSTNEFIIPDLSEPLKNLDRLRSKLGDKLSNFNDAASTVKVESEVMECSLPTSAQELNAEMEPDLVKSSVSVNGGQLYLSSLKKALVGKLNSTPCSTSNLTKFEDDGNGDVVDGAKELSPSQEQANILARLQASIRDKMQNEIWVDNLVSLVSSLPENHRKTVLDRVKHKLSNSESQYCREVPSHTEGNPIEVEHVNRGAYVTASTDPVGIQGIPSERACRTGKTKLLAQVAQPTAQLHLSVNSISRKRKYGKVFFCCDCDYTSKSKEKIEAHVSQEHGVSCNICQQHFTKKNDLDAHVKCHSELRNFTCALCNYHATNKIELLRHMAKHIAKRNFTCEFCGKFFASDCSLLNHIKIVHIELDMISCNLCQFETSSVVGLRQHKVIKHNQWKSFKCPICKDTITQRTSFMLHMKKHTREHLQCSSCREVYLTRALLDKHKQVHPDKYKCNFCTRTLDSKCLLRTHETTHKTVHNNLNPFHCYYCSFSCLSRGSLTRHINYSHVGNSDRIKNFCINPQTAVSIPVTSYSEAIEHVRVQALKTGRTLKIAVQQGSSQMDDKDKETNNGVTQHI